MYFRTSEFGIWRRRSRPPIALCAMKICLYEPLNPNWKDWRKLQLLHFVLTDRFHSKIQKQPFVDVLQNRCSIWYSKDVRKKFTGKHLCRISLKNNNVADLNFVKFSRTQFL